MYKSTRLATAPVERDTVADFGDGMALTGRILLAAVFALSGVSKATAPDAAIGYIASVGQAFPLAVLVVAVAIELGGGAALIVGYRTRTAALALAAFSIAAAVMFHGQVSDQDQSMHFLKNLAIAGGLMQVVAFGAGRWSVDGRRS